MQQGGGIGYDFSTLRPRGAYVKGVGADASGPFSFMDVWDAMCRTIMSAGYRRGAMMATLRCRPSRHRSLYRGQARTRPAADVQPVGAGDRRLHAGGRGGRCPGSCQFGGPGETKTVAKVLPARELWDKIMRATYAYAEPGVIFIDRINRRNNLWYCEEIQATNPCGEQPLPPYGACLLGSINLARFVEQPVHARGAARHRGGSRRWCPTPCGCWTTSSTSRVFRCRQQQEEARQQAAHRPRRHRARRRADPVRAALRLAGGRRRDRGMARRRSSAPPISPRPSWPPRKAPSRCSTAKNTWQARPSPRSTRTCARRSRGTASATRS